MNTIGAMVSVPTTPTLFQVSSLSFHLIVNLIVHGIVKECPPFEASIRFRSFCDKRPEFRGETLNSAIGTAFLQWNSHLGVPTDVWITASTAVVHCTLCDLTRSFPAHVLHLDGEDCSDPGQAIVSANGFDL
jgi:hypothetical protein